MLVRNASTAAAVVERLEDAAPLLDCACGWQALHGQAVSGDLCVVHACSGGALVALIDGLGHGEPAAEAARTAATCIREFAHEPVLSILNRCHKALQPTRGAVMSLASFSAAYHTMSWCGVGNVEGVLLRANAREGPARENLLLLGGLVGYHLPGLRATVVSVHPGDTVLFVTDGIQSGFPPPRLQGVAPTEIAARICREFSRGTDDAAVLVARYCGLP